MYTKDNIINIVDARANKIKSLITFSNSIDKSFPKLSQKKVVGIEKFEDDFAIVPVNTLLWSRLVSKFDDVLKKSYDADELEDEYPSDKTIKGMTLYTNFGGLTSFKLSLIELAAPTTLEDYIRDVEHNYRFGSALESMFGSKHHVSIEISKPEITQLGIYRATELSIQRSYFGRVESIKEVVALIDNQTAIRACYCVDIKQHKLHEAFRCDVKRMLRDIRIKVASRQADTLESFEMKQIPLAVIEADVKEPFQVKQPHKEEKSAPYESAKISICEIVKCWLGKAVRK